ncbi:MAG: YfhO family protein [Elusimicrobiota bacterium]|jgi:uncharacterized membrane protein YfhO|nr:YfhO family protein [Elusimicrobiota bacterium]
MKKVKKLFCIDGPEDKRYCFFIYTFMFVLTFSLVFARLIFSDKTFIYANLDAVYQHYASLVYYGKYLRSTLANFISGNFSVALYDFCIGYGADILTSLHYYVIGDPLSIFSFFVPAKYCEKLYSFLIFLKLYLAGLAFSLYCFKTQTLTKCRPFSVLIGAIIYVFSAYSLIFIAVPLFLNPLIYFPLLLIGVEKIFNSEKSSFFIFIVFISLISNFYFFYILSFMTLIYVFMRLYFIEKTFNCRCKILIVSKLLLSYLVGILCACVVFVPNLIALLDSTRFNASNKPDILYDLYLYKNAFFDFIFARSNTSEIPYALESSGFPLIVLFSVIVLFMRKKFKTLKIAFVAATICALIPFFGYAFTAFSYVSNRWMFAYNFLVSLISVAIVSDLVQKKITQNILILLVIANVAFNSFLFFSSNDVKGKSNFLGTSVATKLFTENEFQLSKKLDDKSFYRVETFSKSERNRAFIANVKGTEFYFSLSNPYINEFYDELGLYCKISDVGYWGLDSRAALNAIANVKYFAIKKDEKIFLPYGYNKKVLDGDCLDGKYEIYQNNFSLPFGYSYSNYVNSVDFKKLSPIQKQNVLLQSVVLEEHLDGDFNLLKNFELYETPVKFGPVKFPYASNKETKELKVAFKSRLFDAQNEDNENYILFHDIKYEGGNKCEILFGEKKTIRFSYPKYLLNFAKRDCVVNTGYIKNGKIDIKVEYANGKVSLQGIEEISVVLGQSYEKKINALKENYLENIQEQNNKIKGNINLKEDKIVVFSIPYSKGWKAFVNGKEHELIRANIAFSALPLKSGNYEIELKYSTPGLKLGCILSLFGAIIFLLGLKNPQKIRWQSVKLFLASTS